MCFYFFIYIKHLINHGEKILTITKDNSTNLDCFLLSNSFFFLFEQNMYCDFLFLEQTTAKLLDGSHQQHGFLSLTYTKAVTKNVRHKLTSRNERRSFHKLSEGLTDGSPHFLHEILLSAQAFDIVLCFPLLNAIASIFQAKLPRTQKEKRKSPGQPMRTHTLTSRNLPLIYINTSVIRIFVPKTEEMQPSIEGILFRIFFSSLILNNF